MENFLDFNKDWFFKKYHKKAIKRYWTWKAALNLFLQRGGKNIVETGTIRQKNDWGGGMSTLILGDFCKKYNKHLWTVDIEPEAIEVAKQVTKRFAGDINYFVSDSIEFLTKFNFPIDLLYLDSFDCPLELDKDPLPAQSHQLKELKAAWPKLSKKAVVLLDDSGHPNGGKTRFSKEFLRKKGLEMVLEYRQSLWIK
ncbi:MAG TPA: class I SAM-dependent methyltransferase [Patescibacteria group bacterium]|nr:class I SAM-dependent methyltransferase [Patescibacteria group bacterium]